jgi:predicted RNA methylase
LPENTLAFDIEPKDNRIIKQDFLDWEPNLDPSKKYIVIGNPPFGLRGQKALQFINKAFTFADFVCFILPPLFNSDGRGSPKKRIS